MPEESPGMIRKQTKGEPETEPYSGPGLGTSQSLGRCKKMTLFTMQRLRVRVDVDFKSGK